MDAGTFIIETFNIITGADYAVGKLSASGLYTSTPGQLQSPLPMVPSSFVTYKSGVTLTMSFKITHAVPIGGKVKITFPSEMYVSSASQVASTCVRVVNNVDTAG